SQRQTITRQISQSYIAELRLGGGFAWIWHIQTFPDGTDGTFSPILMQCTTYARSIIFMRQPPKNFTADEMSAQIVMIMVCTRHIKRTPHLHSLVIIGIRHTLHTQQRSMQRHLQHGGSLLVCRNSLDTFS